MSDINSVTNQIREFILSKNILSKTTPNSLTAIEHKYQAQEDSTDKYRTDQLVKNSYTSTDGNQKIIIENKPNENLSDYDYLELVTQQKKDNKVYDTLGSIITGDGFSLTNNGIHPNFDIRTTLLGDILSATGVITDTKLGMIGNSQLSLALQQRAVNNVQNELFSTFNLNPISLIKGEDFYRYDYDITHEYKTGVNKVFNNILDVFDINLNNVDVTQDSRIFNDKYTPLRFKKSNPIISDVLVDKTKEGDQIILDKYQSLLDVTGKGQASELFTQLNYNIYKPHYVYNQGKLPFPLNNDTDHENNNEYGYTVGPEGINNKTFIWGSDEKISSNKDTILSKTKEIFNASLRLTNIVTHNDPIVINNNEGDEISNYGLIGGKKYLSGGSQVKTINQREFARVWKKSNPYGKVGSLQKHSGLITFPNKLRDKTDLSVLDDNGFVKITPYRGDNFSLNDVKKYMFSLENLAWKGATQFLNRSEIGNGDSITGEKGRIMWFPPYDLKFSESTSVSNDRTDFIGRGEPIFTYNNTTRTGQLSFKIIMDHPDYLNSVIHIPNKIDDIIESVISGEGNINQYLSQIEEDQVKTSGFSETKKSTAVSGEKPTDFNVYFSNNNSSIPTEYEITGEWGNLNPTIGDNGTSYPNSTNTGLNNDWGVDTGSFMNNISTIMNRNSAVIIKVIGYASDRGVTTSNQALAEKRAKSVVEWLKNQLSSVENIKIQSTIGGELSNTTATVDSSIEKNARVVKIEFQEDASRNKEVEQISNAKFEKNADGPTLNDSIRRRYFDESLYFKKLSEDSPILYERITDYIDYFQPAFHSVTPEGFNARLTFLEQCTRQGPTTKDSGTQNLSFGEPPVCILRVGDFYHTKIIIESKNVDFEPLLWDINPEGVGVQPMIANVSIAFNFIGGSSLGNAVKELQNALSFNFYANTEIYDPRANSSYVEEKKDPDTTYTDELNSIISSEKYKQKFINKTTIEPRPYAQLVNIENTIAGTYIPNEPVQLKSIEDVTITNIESDTYIVSTKLISTGISYDNSDDDNLKIKNLIDRGITLHLKYIENGANESILRERIKSSDIATKDFRLSKNNGFQLGSDKNNENYVLKNLKTGKYSLTLYLGKKRIKIKTFNIN